MRTLQWQKIPIASVIGKANLWTMVGRMGNNYEMDYTKMDALFSVNHNSGPKRPGPEQDMTNSDSKKKKENVEINILDGKRSLNVNIFLKQFRMSHEEIVDLVRNGHSGTFGAERLRGLLKLLPSQDEIDAIKAFDGDKERLGNAEKFFICMMGLANYRMRIEGLLIMEEFNSNMEWIRPSIEAVIQASKDIQESKSLKELIFLILIAGNYLNSGNYAGNAAGFKLSSLLKLTEIRANKPRMNLLHYVAQEAKEKNPKLLQFPQEMRYLKDAAQVSVETLSQDIKNIANKVRAITEQIVVAGVDFQKQMEHFLKEANVEVVELEEDLNEIETMREELSTFFAEDSRSFKLEECFTILQTFCERFKKAIEENSQREIQEQKAEQRRRTTQEENGKRNSKEHPDSPDESLDQTASGEEEDGSIVDMLLADVRSGFSSRKFNDGNFSVQKVTKVNLLDALSSGNGAAAASPTLPKNPPSFIRRGYGRVSQRKKLQSSKVEDLSPSPTPDSTNQRRARRSFASDGSDESLIDFLTENEGGVTPDSPKPENTFERYGSLRRRHQERKEKRKGALEIILPGRELASPSIPENSPLGSDSPTPAALNRLQADKEPQTKTGRSMRRTRSWLDRPSVDKANAEHKKEESSKAKGDSSDALLDRIKQKLNKKAEERHTRLGGEEERDRLGVHDSSLNDEESGRVSNRWRSGIAMPDNSLGTISEKGTRDIKHNVIRREKSDSTKVQYRNSVGPSEFARIVQNSEIHTRPVRSQDDSDMKSPNIAVSVRKQISSGIGTNIDQVLKTIEDSGRTIDTVGVSGPIKRTREVTEPKTEAPQQTGHHSQVAVVAHVTAPFRPLTPVDLDLKTKRDKRKKRSTLTLEDVKAAMKSDSPLSDQLEQVPMAQDPISKPAETTIYYQAETGKPVAKTPPSPRRPTSDVEKTSQENSVNNKELSKAAKLAAKKKFRDARFGDSSSNSESRTKSNVEPDGVDKALKELANQNSMSRSKSYDEHVADNEFSNNVMKRNNNSGSAPDTSAEKKAVKRNSASRLSLDGRRNGLYIPSDESDTELTPEDAGTHRLSIAKSDSPHSVSQLSLKSTNTSTETLQADIESSPEQRRRNSEALSNRPTSEFPRASVLPGSHENQSTPMNHLGVPMQPRPQSTTAVDLEQSTLRRSYSLMERTKLHNDDEDNDNPAVKMAKWRLNRRNRSTRSVYDNVPEIDSSRSLLSPTNTLSPDPLQPFKTEVSELKNEVGSRSSYASSYASSNERDEGFETGSGTPSQRDSMSSTIDSDIYAIAASASTTCATPSAARREVFKSKSNEDKTDSNNKSVIKTLPESDSVISSLSVEADRKERTETWTEQTVRANSINTISKDQSCDSSSEYAALSPDSGHSTSKEDIWSEDLNVKTEPKETKKKDTTPPSGTKTPVSKTKSVPSYMRSTSSSITAAKPASRAATKTSTTSTPPPSSSVSPFRRDTPQRISFKEKEVTPTIRRDTTMRASMRAESASSGSGFQRGTMARRSVRRPPVGQSTATTTMSSPSAGTSTLRGRSDSTASLSSTTSSSSNISSNISSTTARHVTPSVSNKSSPVTRSSSTRTVSMRAKTPTTTQSSSTVNRSSGSFSKKPLSSSLSDTTPRRAVTPLSHEMKRSSTPLSHEGSRSTTPLPERPRSTTPMSEARPPSRRSSFMAPTAASKAKKGAETSASAVKAKSPTTKSTGGLLRTASLRLPRKSTDVSPGSSLQDIPGGRKSPAMVETTLPYKGEHYQSLSTVAEQDEDATKTSDDTAKKVPSLFKRIGIVKGKPSTTQQSKPKTKPGTSSTRK